MALSSLRKQRNGPGGLTRIRRHCLPDMTDVLFLTLSIPRYRTANRRRQAATAPRGK
ncbi:hypothetical protein DPMN_043127 [Dreissena polymorpha]|uniref:Uncharacterized protein n=1 Tax=Dreissena polymorpha TaxID=45954 RepID=A0A9D4HZD2_DREPO|nr:hypothetical protein DPMN_043127 [Dreissena polymorpha]